MISEIKRRNNNDPIIHYFSSYKLLRKEGYDNPISVEVKIINCKKTSYC